MVQYRTGTFVSTAAAVTIPLGFVPDRFEIFDLTILENNPPDSTTPVSSLWLKGMPNASALNTVAGTAGALSATYSSSNGVTPVVLGGDWQNTIYTITGITNANPGVVTVSSVSPTNSMTLVNGMTFTISSVVGMQNLNTNRFVVAGLSGTSFNLYDTFGNPVDTTGFGTYVSGGQMDVISYPQTAPILNPVNGQVITPGSPAGLQYDIGYEGVTLGTAVVGASTNVMRWYAYYQTPTGW